MKFNIEEIKRKMLVKYPYFGSVIASVKYQLNEKIPTACTDGITVYYNPKFFETLDKEEQTFVLTHEICHIAFDHIRRSENKDQQIWNIATDAVINAHLKKDGLKVPRGAVEIEDAIEYDSETLYEKIKEEKQSQPQSQGKDQDRNSSNNESNEKSESSGSGSSQDSNQEQGENQESQSSNSDSSSSGEQNEKKQNQSGGKKTSEEEKEDNKNGNSSGESKKENQDNNQKNQLVEDDSNDKNEESDKEGNTSGKEDKDEEFDSHSMWEEGLKRLKEEQENQDKKDNDDKNNNQRDKEDISKNEKDAFEKNLEEKKKQLQKLKEELISTSKQAGDASAGFYRDVDRSGRQKEIIDWRYVLREAVKYDVDWSTRNCYIEDGVVCSTLEEYPTPEAEIVLDTSGSISETLLRNFLRECKNILDHSRVRVGCFDTKFYGFTEIRNETDIEKMKFQGGGGTDFNVAVDAFTRRVENKIIFTDGYASMPEKQMDAIWVVFGDDEIKPKGGRVIYVTPDMLYRLQNGRPKVKKR